MFDETPDENTPATPSSEPAEAEPTTDEPKPEGEGQPEAPAAE